MKSWSATVPKRYVADQCLSRHGGETGSGHEQLTPRHVQRRETRQLSIELALRPGVELLAVGERDVQVFDDHRQVALLQPRGELLARTVVRLIELGARTHRPLGNEEEHTGDEWLARPIANTVLLGHDDLHRVVDVGEKLHLEPP